MDQKITIQEYVNDCVYATQPPSDKTIEILNGNKISNNNFDINFPSCLLFNQSSHMLDDTTHLNWSDTWRSKQRRQFKSFMNDMGWSFKELCDQMDGIQNQEHIYSNSLRIQAIIEQVPRKVLQRKNRILKHHNRRLDVSRVVLRKNIPNDLIPLICAYAVPDSKQYNYMKN